MLAHWLLTARMMAVSGRFTALVNRFRFGHPEEDDVGLSPEELLLALQAATFDAFGEPPATPRAPALELGASPNHGHEAESPAGHVASISAPMDHPERLPAVPLGVIDHLLFLGALFAGALMVSLAQGRFQLDPLLRSAAFSATFGEGLGGALVLLLGGGLVGFGTRMAGGCTSGHGLCGVSRMQPGSLLATAGFFGTGVATSFLLRAL